MRVREKEVIIKEKKEKKFFEVDEHDEDVKKLIDSGKIKFSFKEIWGKGEDGFDYILF